MTFDESEGGQALDIQHFFKHVQAPAFRFKSCKSEEVILPSRFNACFDVHNWAYDFSEPDSTTSPAMDGRVELSFLRSTDGKPHVVFSFGRANSQTQGRYEHLPQERSLRYFLVFSGRGHKTASELVDAFKLPFVLLQSVKRFWEEWFEEVPSRVRPLEQWEKNTARTILLRIRERLEQNEGILPVLEKPWWHAFLRLVPNSKIKLADFNQHREAALEARKHVLSVLKSL